MNNIGLFEHSFDYDRLSILFEMFKQTFEESYKKINSERGYTIKIQDKLETELLKKVIEHYADHALTYNIQIDDVCPYKILSWSGYILADMVYADDENGQVFAFQAISSCIVCMLILLEIDGVIIEEGFHKKALAMVISEIRGSRKNGDTNAHTKLGLGMNGLYMMFRTASIVKSAKEKSLES